ncbi:MAG: urease accessory protein UreD [Alphaproteobacteria bacterium]|nr:urease accessory protein UreD [Alphaproteobacteria bacterium]
MPGEAVAVPARGRVRVDGGARIAFVAADGETRLRELWQHDPMRVLLPRPVDDTLPHVVLLNTSGGLVGGDRIAIEVALADGARALVTSQAAEKVYRSAGPDTTIDNRLSVGADAWLEWLPNETILFDGGRLVRRLRIDLAAGARLLAGEIAVFGRIARGENVTRGLLHDAWNLRREGQEIWADALRLDGDIAARLADPHGIGGARAAGLLVCSSPGAVAQLEAVRERIGAETGSAASAMGDVLLVRFLMDDPQRLRRLFGRIWTDLRVRLAGLPPILPRLWHI